MNVSKREAEAAASRARKAKKINFICDLFKTYVGVYGNTSSGKVRSVDKIVQATHQSRCTIYRILKKYGAIPPEEDGRRSKWAGGISDEIAKAIKLRVLSLHKICRGIMSLEIIQKTLEEEYLFTSSSTSLYRLLRQLGFDYNRCAAAWTVANEKFFDESVTDEQLNHNQGHFAQFSNTNMMEVKHSPSSQMEFRPTANNSLAHDVEDKNLDTLFENGEKSLTSTSDTCDSSAPTMNGVSKHGSKHGGLSLDGMEIDLCEDDDGDTNDKADDVLEDMEIDLPIPVEAESSDAKKENEETEEVKEDLEVFDIDLDEEAAAKVENGAVESTDTDPSKVRDTGDDLDTLLSKINDLVEDCMEPKVAGADTADEAVPITEADIEDEEAPNKAAAENGSHPEIEPKVVSEKAEAELETESVAGETPASASEEVASNKTAAKEELESDLYDDDVVCLDSPLPEESQAIDDKMTTEETAPKTEEAAETVQPAEEEKEPSTEESKDEELTEKPSETEEITEDTEKAAEEADTSELAKSEEVREPTKETKETTPKEPDAIDDDEIFLIDDDDDDDVPMDAAVSPAKPEKEETSSEEPELEGENKVEETVDELPKTDEEVKIPEVESEAECPQKAAEEKPAVEDDDIVCLDDSMDGAEEKAEEGKENDANEVNAKPTEEVTLPAESEKLVNSELEKESDKKEKESEKVEMDSEEVEKESEKIEKESEKENLEEIIAEPVLEKDSTGLEEKTKSETSPSEVTVPPATEMDVQPVAEEDVPPVAVPESNVEKQAEAEKSSSANIADDIVILDDDDDEAEVTSSTATEKASEKSTTVDSTDKKSPEEATKPEQASSSDESAPLKPSTILSDNSDNARDGVEEKEENAEAKAAVEKTPVPSESTTCNSNSSNLLKETAKERDEAPEQPPAKRIRLSQDEANSRHSTASQDDAKSNIVDDDDVMEVISKEDEDSKSLKRVHSTDSISSDFKKPKTEEEPLKKVEVKSFSLYPAPKLQEPSVDLSLDFLRRFKKSIYKMTKTDLEELVLQKIVEAIVHKSEFSEMRELLEKQEKIISGFRTKISELNKQFRDLEMVHNRVLKDLETKNSQFIMPVKITRAVGLQVFFPNKKYDQPLMAQSNTPTQTAAPVQAAKTVTSLNNSLPDKPAVASTLAANVGSTATTPTAVATQATQAAPVNNSLQQQAAAQRRGCVQKLTPMRPDTPRNSPLNRVVATTASPSPSPSTTPTGAAKELPPKILNRSVAQKTRIGMPVGANTSPAGMVKTIQAPPLPVEKQKAPIAQQVVTTNKSPLNRWAPPKGPTDSHTVAHPVPQSAAAVSIPNTPVSTTTVTPKHPTKSVIDLTDEDEVAPTPAAMNGPKTPMTTVPPTTPSPVNVAPNRGPYKVSVIPQQQLQQPRPNPPKQTPQRPQGPLIQKINAPVVTVRQISPNPVRYRHPAPLPNQPLHSSNPAWKLPPARPTIRISNLESGIVISWTIEDTAKEKYAESTSYQIYAYQETSGPPEVSSWRHVGDVKAMLLPMAVTLTQFQEGQRYYFAVRAVDAHKRCGPFSFAKTWS